MSTAESARSAPRRPKSIKHEQDEQLKMVIKEELEGQHSTVKERRRRPPSPGASNDKEDHASHSAKRRRRRESDGHKAPVGVKKKDFSMSDITASICADPPTFMNLRDDQLCAALLKDMDCAMLDDMVSYFLKSEGILEDESYSWGGPKWLYTKGHQFDSFDYYAATGCPNCGAAYELEQPYVHAHREDPALLCLQCGHKACPMHTPWQSDSLMDRYEFYEEQKKSGDSRKAGIEPAFYVRGTRERWHPGQAGKEWWQSRYLPSALRLKELDRTITTISLMSKLKAPTIRELCEVCGNAEAYYSTFQARSADEGMTIMYECTRCHHRKVFNN